MDTLTMIFAGLAVVTLLFMGWAAVSSQPLRQRLANRAGLPTRQEIRRVALGVWGMGFVLSAAVALAWLMSVAYVAEDLPATIWLWMLLGLGAFALIFPLLLTLTLTGQYWRLLVADDSPDDHTPTPPTPRRDRPSTQPSGNGRTAGK